MLSPTLRVPFNRPTLAGREFEFMLDAIRLGHSAGDGGYTRKCRDFLEQYLESKAALLTPSCTAALEMTALLLDIRPGDEVIVPSFTFVSTVNAFVLRGAKPVFADIREDTLNLDETRLEALITPRTRAIVVVHYAGIGCEMDTIMEIAKRRSIPVVEDNAHGLFGKYRGRLLGTFGAFATQSFHETKNIICGEGGALLVNDAQFTERAEIVREKGTNRSRFYRGMVDKYTWCDVGSSYLLSDMLAAYLWAQLQARDTIQRSRAQLWKRYDDAIKPWASSRDIRRPIVPSHCEQSFHMYYLLFPSLEARTETLARLKAAGVLAVFHYLPLHLSEMGRKLGGEPGQCPVTERISDRLVRLPFFTNMTNDEQDIVLTELLR